MSPLEKMTIRGLIYTVGENIIATIKMRNDFCYPLEMVRVITLRGEIEKSPILLSQ